MAKPKKDALSADEADASDPAPPPEAHATEDEPTMEERARALVASYEHAMEHSSPRTMAELNELKALLLGKG